MHPFKPRKDLYNSLNLVTFVMLVWSYNQPGSSLPVTFSKKVRVLSLVTCSGRLRNRFLEEASGIQKHRTTGSLVS